MKTLKVARYGHTSVCLGGRLFVCGGATSDFVGFAGAIKPTGSCEALDLEKESWSATGEMPFAVAFASAVAVGSY